MALDSGFWEKLLPAAGQAGLGMLSGGMAVKEADRRSQEARGAAEPYSSAALNQLLQAQQFNTGANAKERYEQQMALMKPGQEAERLSLMRKLQKQGLLGLSSNEPTTGLAEGTAHNPFVSSLLGAQETARQQAAARALDDSQRTLNEMVTRSASLQQGANAAQNRMMNSQPTASKASMFGEIAKGLGGMLGNKDVMSALMGAFKGGAPAGNQWANPSAGARGFTTDPALADLDPTMGFSFDQPRFDDWSGGDWGGGWGADEWNLGSGWGY